MRKEIIAFIAVLGIGVAALTYVGLTRKSEVAEPTSETMATVDRTEPELVSPPADTVVEETVTETETSSPSGKTTVTKSKSVRVKKSDEIAPVILDEDRKSVAAVESPAGDASRSLTVTNPEVVGEPSALGINVIAGHTSGLRDGVRSFTEFLVELTYRLGINDLIGVGQEAKKLYEIAPGGENEFLAGDTLIFYRHNLSKDALGMNWELDASATLPISEASRNNKHITQVSLGVPVSTTLANRVAVKVAPMVSYNFNSYGTDPAGQPLQRISFSALAEADVRLFAPLHWVTWGQGGYHLYEEFDNSSTTGAPTTSYAYGTYLQYNFTSYFGSQLGYVNGNSIFKDPRYQARFYDAPTSRYYVAVELKF